MLKAAIVGCGKIADDHASSISRIPGCEMVAACDREPIMARQLHDRYPIHGWFDSVEEMLAKAKPDVVHVTTPPASHFGIAKQCLLAGCHVYVEKPFTVDEREAQALINLAQEKGLQVTAGHDDQFRHAARRMRELIRQGYLGAGPVHMDSYYGYEIDHAGYAGALLGDKRHWIRGLPGRLLHNIISHGIARIAEFLTTDHPRVIAYGFISPFLRSLGETEIVDELRVMISDADRMTAYFTFSSQMRPALHEFRIYGSSNGLVLDQDQETLVRLPGRRRKSYVEKFVSPALVASDYLMNVVTNARLFVGNDFHMKAGMKFLIESFYRSVTEDAPPPISYREIVMVARIMDEIFAQVNAQRAVREVGGEAAEQVESQSGGILHRGR